MVETAVLVAVVVGLVEVVKRIGLPKKLLPLLAVLLGMGGSLLFVDGTAGVLVLEGLVAGLTAVGLYSGVKNTAK